MFWKKTSSVREWIGWTKNGSGGHPVRKLSCPNPGKWLWWPEGRSWRGHGGEVLNLRSILELHLMELSDGFEIKRNKRGLWFEWLLAGGAIYWGESHIVEETGFRKENRRSYVWYFMFGNYVRYPVEVADRDLVRPVWARWARSEMDIKAWEPSSRRWYQLHGNGLDHFGGESRERISSPGTEL